MNGQQKKPPGGPKAAPQPANHTPGPDAIPYIETQKNRPYKGPQPSQSIKAKT